MENNIIQLPMEEVMHNSIMPYAEYVILERSLPRVEDGLKPVQRRILYAMYTLSITPDKPYKKSATIVGETLGKYHPHGDTSVYDAMVRMAQSYNMGMPLVDGQGNFGSVDGDSAAAMRYTESRLTNIAMELLTDIEKNALPFQFNYSDELKEPVILAGSFPNLLVNGSTGIAVGLATNIPSHNLEEVIDGVVAQIRNENISLETLMDIVKGPDFPTGGIMFASDELFKAYETGKGKIYLRAKVEVEHQTNGKINLVIRELPYQVNKALLLEKILKVSEDKKELFAAINDIRDESDKDGMRGIIELKKDSDHEAVLKALYKYSDLQISYSINMVAIAKGKPRQMGLLEINRHYIEHRRNVVTKRLEYDVEKARAREHILLGLKIAVEDIDNVIALIKAASSPKEAKLALMEKYELSEIQAQAILDMRLQRLTALQTLAIKKEYDELVKQIAYLLGILNSPTKLDNLIIKELETLKEKYKIKRRTNIIWDENPNVEIALPKKSEVREETLISLLTNGHIVRSDKELLKTSCSFTTFSNEKFYIFTNLGNCYSIVPNDLEKNEKGVLLSGLFAGVLDTEEIIKVMPHINEEELLYFYTEQGMLKATLGKEYLSSKSKITAIKLKDGDSLLNVEVKDELKSNLIITALGMSIRFTHEGINPIGRNTAGIKGIKLGKEDRVIFAGQVLENGMVVTISDRGYAKKTEISEYELQGKNGKGLKTFDFKANHANGYALAFAKYINENVNLKIMQKNNEKTVVNTEEIMYEQRYSKGKNLIIVLMDNIIVKCDIINE